MILKVDRSSRVIVKLFQGWTCHRQKAHQHSQKIKTEAKIKRTRAGSQKEAPDPPSNPQDVIELDSDEGSDNGLKPTLRFIQTQLAVFKFIINKKICGRTIRKDQSRSTKNFHAHLMRMHRLVDPKLGKKIDQAPANMAKYLKTTESCQRYVFQTLETVITYFIAEADLPFGVVEQKSFQNVVKINLLAKQQSIPLTQDAWTASNVTDFMAVTAQCINDSYIMENLTIAIPHVQGML
ncbi:hypothetical protein VP01_1213g5 [Puccinia sorghi]|uniref:HAT C-terminal dimerisation domain-containing protein n=1 Tax=Puccinia sorghi TaxID=27349 RepID=A0A0L6VQB0_9BASI|nr:hypothetical protein VP01_1213g5 [Puccinia sorghi]